MLRPALAALLLALPAGTALAQDDTPPVIGTLVLTDTQVIPRSNPAQGQVILGTLPGGALVEVELRADGSLDEIEAAGASLIPIAAIQQVIPEAIVTSTEWPAGALLESVDFERDGSVQIEGYFADGREFEADFKSDGVLTELDLD